MSRFKGLASKFDLIVELAVFVLALLLFAAFVAVDVDDVVALLSPDGSVSEYNRTLVRFALWAMGAVSVALLLLQMALVLGAGRSSLGLLKDIAASAARNPRASVAAALTVTLAMSLALNTRLKPVSEWKDAHGAEYYDIARAIASGNGFSWTEADRWFWIDFDPASEYDEEKFYPTAMEEPIYPYLLGYALRAFGDNGITIVVGLQLLAWVFACVLLYLLGRDLFSWQVGFAAAAALALWPAADYLVMGYLGPSPLGLLLFTAVAYLVTRNLESERFTVWLVVTGLALGAGLLTIASSQVFVPIALATVIVARGWKRPASWLEATALLALVAAVVAPWTLRNWSTFGEFVPVRVGLGLISHQGNPILAGTFMPGPHACTDSLGPMWQADGIDDAIGQATTRQDKEIEIYRRSYECISLNAPDGYEHFNEPQRDAVYKQAAREFIFDHPWVFAKMAFFKYLYAVKGEGSILQVLAGALCLAGLVPAAAGIRALPVVFMILAYFAPYALGIPWGYRYRFPIEPLIILLGTYAVSFWGGAIARRLSKIRRTSMTQTEMR